MKAILSLHGEKRKGESGTGFLLILAGPLNMLTVDFSDRAK